MKRLALLSAGFLSLVASAGCNEDSTNDSSGDAATSPDAASGADAEGNENTGNCGTGSSDAESIDTAGITGTEGLAMASDGTLYYSQSGAVGRLLPGEAPDNSYAELPGAETVWGMALNAEGTLFVAAPPAPPSLGRIFAVDTTQDPPDTQELVANAGGANGLTLSPSGAVHFTDMYVGRVQRVEPSGELTAVTTSPLMSPNGLVFESETSLLVLEYTAGLIWRLTLGEDGIETNREQLISVAPARPDGIAIGPGGWLFVSDNNAGSLLKIPADLSDVLTAKEDIPAAANIVFGQGPWHCNDVYVASSGALGLYQISAE